MSENGKTVRYNCILEDDAGRKVKLNEIISHFRESQRNGTPIIFGCSENLPLDSKIELWGLIPMRVIRRSTYDAAVALAGGNPVEREPYFFELELLET